MINKEKVAVMTGMAAYEAKEGKKDAKICKFFCNDYIGFNLLKTWVCITVAFLIIVVLYAVSSMDEMMMSIYTMKTEGIAQLLKKFAGVYVGVCLFYFAVNAFVSYIRYRFASARRRRFERDLDMIIGRAEMEGGTEE